MKKTPAKKYYKDEKLLIRIGEKLRQAREAKNISIETLANNCEIDYSQINRMELGKVNFNISIFYRIAKGLGIDPKEILP